MRLALASLLLLSTAAHTQTAPPPRHLISKTSPNYPAIARAAHVTGDVKLKFEIDAAGHVGNIKTLSGPPMLVGAAQDCVKKWIYTAGAPTSSVITMNFDIPQPEAPREARIAETYFPLSDACHKAFSAGVTQGEQADACGKAAAVADSFAPTGRFIERRSAFVYAAMAFQRNGQREQALAYAKKAVAVVEQGHDDGSGSSAAYAVRARAESIEGDERTADRDFSKAEDLERKALAEIESDFLKREYAFSLHSLLTMHAKLLEHMGRVNDAQDKAEEAKKLEPLIKR